MLLFLAVQSSKLSSAFQISTSGSFVGTRCLRPLEVNVFFRAFAIVSKVYKKEWYFCASERQNSVILIFLTGNVFRKDKRFTKSLPHWKEIVALTVFETTVWNYFLLHRIFLASFVCQLLKVVINRRTLLTIALPGLTQLFVLLLQADWRSFVEIIKTCVKMHRLTSVTWTTSRHHQPLVIRAQDAPKELLSLLSYLFCILATKKAPLTRL